MTETNVPNIGQACQLKGRCTALTSCKKETVLRFLLPKMARVSKQGRKKLREEDDQKREGMSERSKGAKVESRRCTSAFQQYTLPRGFLFHVAEIIHPYHRVLLLCMLLQPGNFPKMTGELTDTQKKK